MTDDQTTITVRRETKDRLGSLKRDGLTWDAFLNDLADDVENNAE